MKTILYVLGILGMLILWGLSKQIGREIGGSLAGGQVRKNSISIESIVKEMADGLSRELPKSLNSELVLNGVYASGNTINYQLAFVNYIDGTVSNDLVIRAVDNTKRAALTTMCTGSMGQYLKMGAIVIYHYYDSRGSYLRNVTIQTTYNDCVQAGLVR